MTDNGKRIIVVGAGIFGVTAALELRQRGHSVRLFDPGPLPHPEAASTDISKVLRMDYGADEFYLELMEDSFEGWTSWNKDLGETVFHRTGVLMISREEMRPGGYEYESYQLLRKRGHPVKRITGPSLKTQFPAWNSQEYPDGYYNPLGGWAPSGRVVELLIKKSQQAGVKLHEEEAFAGFLENGSGLGGITTAKDVHYEADFVIVAAGAWTPTLLPHLQELMWAIGQPVIHFQPKDPQEYQPPGFIVWTADVGRTGWYGFPAQEDGVLKIANHGPGWRVDPRDPRMVPADQEAKFQAFFAKALPGLVDAPKVADRLCLYCDTWDTDFYIDHDPDHEGLLICSGGSGHGFKFAPMLGKITADALEGKPNKYAPRFAWRSKGELSAEEARFSDFR